MGYIGIKLHIHLLRLVEEEAARSQLGAAARPLGVPSYEFVYDKSYAEEFTVSDQIIDSDEYSLSILEKALLDHGLLNEFKEYLYSRLFNKHDANEVYNTLVKYGLIVLRNPLSISRLRPSTAKRLLRGYAAMRDFLKLMGYKMLISDFLRELRRLIPKTNSIEILDYEIDKSIIDKAIEQLHILKDSKKWLLVHMLAFFTGLRGDEVVYLIKNYKHLRKLYLDKVVVVELNFIRKSKRAYITVFPKELEKHIIKYMDEIGYRVVDNIRDKKGIGISLYRKVHDAILSETMKKHEIELLQGKVSNILVKHYTKHIRRIAEKYVEAYKSYWSLISLLEC